MTKYKVHASITGNRILDAVQRQMFELDNPGFCLLCGEEANECEPDAQRYTCDYCGSKAVYGAEIILEMGMYHESKSTEGIDENA